MNKTKKLFKLLLGATMALFLGGLSMDGCEISREEARQILDDKFGNPIVVKCPPNAEYCTGLGGNSFNILADSSYFSEAKRVEGYEGCLLAFVKINLYGPLDDSSISKIEVKRGVPVHSCKADLNAAVYKYNKDLFSVSE